MKNRTSSHFFILVLIVFVTAIAHYSIHYGALIRGYDTSAVTAVRNLSLLSFLAVLPIFLKRFIKFDGNWTLYTSCFAIFDRFDCSVSLIQRSDTHPAEIRPRRVRKDQGSQMHYIQENYSAEKSRCGLPPTPPAPVDPSTETPKPQTRASRPS